MLAPTDYSFKLHSVDAASSASPADLDGMGCGAVYESSSMSSRINSLTGWGAVEALVLAFACKYQLLTPGTRATDRNVWQNSRMFGPM